MPEELRIYTQEELAHCDGREGRPACVAANGKVYDVSGSKLWKGGSHMRRHAAGADMTEDLKGAPHSEALLERCPQVGILAGTAAAPSPAAASGSGEGLPRLLRRFPMLKRHPHPMTVHFPIAFAMVSAAFVVLYLLTGMVEFETAALDCLGAGTVATPVAILTGWYTWKLNYGGQYIRPVTAKLVLTPILFLNFAAAFAWRFVDPHILEHPGSGRILFIGLVLLLVPLVSAIGWYGASLTFPAHE